MQKNILVVEDNSDIQRTIERAINKMQHSVKILRAMNLERARKLLESHKIYIIILDVKLPDGNGVVWAANEVRKIHPYLPIIVETDIKDKRLSQIAYDDIHCLSFLNKPLSENSIIHAIENVYGMEKMFNETRHTIRIKKRATFLIKIERILYIDVMDSTTRIFTWDTKLERIEVREIRRYPLKNIISSLDEEDQKSLIQCHRSYIINPNYVTQIHPNYQIELEHVSERIPVSRQYRHLFD